MADQDASGVGKDESAAPNLQKEKEELEKVRDEAGKLAEKVAKEPENIIGETGENENNERKEVHSFLKRLEEKVDKILTDVDERKRKDMESLKDSTTPPEKKSWLNKRIL